jgi:hypothetical protein
MAEDGGSAIKTRIWSSFVSYRTCDSFPRGASRLHRLIAPQGEQFAVALARGSRPERDEIRGSQKLVSGRACILSVVAAADAPNPA